MPRKKCILGCGALIRKRNFEEDECCDAFMTGMELHVWSRCPVTWKICRKCDTQFSQQDFLSHDCTFKRSEVSAILMQPGQWVDISVDKEWKVGIYTGMSHNHNYVFFSRLCEPAKRERVHQIYPFRQFTVGKEKK
jgi:hypothetical protein